MSAEQKSKSDPLADVVQLCKSGRRSAQQELYSGDSKSSLQAYRNLAVGSGSVFFWLYYELCMLLSGIPGLLGFGLRSVIPF